MRRPGVHHVKDPWRSHTLLTLARILKLALWSQDQRKRVQDQHDAAREVRLYLTNITHATLPQGALATCTLAVEEAAAGSLLPISFDQRMHVGAGDRPGTWMAVSFELPGPATRQELGAAWLRLIRRHQTLRTVFRTPSDYHGDAQLTLHQIHEPLSVRWQEHPSTAEGTRATLKTVLDRACSPLGTPSHRLCVIHPEDTSQSPTVVLAADHSHVDAWSLPVLAHDFLEALVLVKSPASDDPVAQAASFAEHTRALAEAASAPQTIHQRWQEIVSAGHGTMPTFPLPLGQLQPTPAEAVTTRAVLDAQQLRDLEDHAQDVGHRPFTMVISSMTQACSELAGSPLRAVLPVHSRTEPRWQEAVGWFITNSVVESSNPDLAMCRAAVREALQLGSHALEPIMRPYGGMPVPPGMFMISYLDYRRLPAALPQSLNPQHISASAPTNGVQVWCVVTDSGLHIRARYPDTPRAQESVETWLAAVIGHLQKLAAGTPESRRIETLRMK